MCLWPLGEGEISHNALRLLHIRTHSTTSTSDSLGSGLGFFLPLFQLI
uniref:Uncharacterized protein n=1 Tax=Anguilla anguilla TaxID=7936 RepID=A0A0E9V433_ANGAN